MKLALFFLIFGLIMGALGSGLWQYGDDEVMMGAGLGMLVLGGGFFLIGLIRMIIKR